MEWLSSTYALDTLVKKEFFEISVVFMVRQKFKKIPVRVNQMR